MDVVAGKLGLGEWVGISAVACESAVVKTAVVASPEVASFAQGGETAGRPAREWLGQIAPVGILLGLLPSLSFLLIL